MASPNSDPALDFIDTEHQYAGILVMATDPVAEPSIETYLDTIQRPYGIIDARQIEAQKLTEQLKAANERAETADRAALNSAAATVKNAGFLSLDNVRLRAEVKRLTALTAGYEIAESPKTKSGCTNHGLISNENLKELLDFANKYTKVAPNLGLRISNYMAECQQSGVCKLCDDHHCESQPCALREGRPSAGKPTCGQTCGGGQQCSGATTGSSSDCNIDFDEYIRLFDETVENAHRLQDRIRILEATLECKDTVSSDGADIARLNAEISRLTRRLDDAKAGLPIIDYTNEEGQRLRSDLAVANTRIAGLRINLAEANSHIAELNNAMTVMQAGITANALYARLINELTSSNTKIEEQKESIAYFQNKQRENTKEVDNLNEQIRGLESRLGQQIEELEDLEQQVQDSDNHSTASTTPKKPVTNAQVASTQTADNFEGTNARLRSELAAAKPQVKRLEARIETLGTEVTEPNAKMYETVENKDDEINSLQTLVDSLGHRLQECIDSGSPVPAGHNAEGHNARLNKRIRDIDGQVADLRAQLHESQDKISELESEKHLPGGGAELHDCNARKGPEVERLQLRIKSLDIQVAELVENLTEAETLVSKLEEQIGEDGDDHIPHGADTARYQQDLAGCQDDAVKAAAKMAVLRQILERWDSDWEAAEAEALEETERLHGLLEECTTEKAALLKNVGNNPADASKDITELAARANRAIRLEAEILEAEQIIESLEASLKANRATADQEEFERINEKIDKLTKELEAAEEARAEAQEELSKEKVALEDLERRLEDVVAQRDVSLRQQAEQLQSSQDRDNEYKNEIARVNNLLTDCNNRPAILERIPATQRADLAKLRKTIKDLKAEREILQTNVEGLVEDPEQLATLTALRAQVKDLERQLKTANRRVTTRDTRAKQATADIIRLENTIDQRDVTIIRIRGERTAAREDRDALRVRVQEAEEAVGGDQTAVQAKLKAALEKAREPESAQVNLALLYQDLVLERDQARTQIAVLKAMITDLEARLAAAGQGQGADTIQNQNQNLIFERDQAREYNSVLRTKIPELEAEIADLEAQIATARDAQGQLGQGANDSCEAKAGLRNTIAELQKQLTSSQNMLDASRQASGDAQDESARQLRQVREELDDARDAAERLQNELNSTGSNENEPESARNATLVKRLKQAECQIRRLQQAMHNMDTQLNCGTTKNVEVTELRAQLATAQTNIQRLTLHLAPDEAEVERLRTEVERLNALLQEQHDATRRLATAEADLARMQALHEQHHAHQPGDDILDDCPEVLRRIQQAEILRLRAELDARPQVEQLQRHVEQLNREIGQHLANLAVAQDQMSDLTAELQSGYTGADAGLRQRLTDCNNSVQAKDEQIAKLTESNGRLQNESRACIQQLTTKISGSGVEHARLGAEVKKLLSITERLDEELKAVRDAIDTLGPHEVQEFKRSFNIMLRKTTQLQQQLGSLMSTAESGPDDETQYKNLIQTLTEHNVRIQRELHEHSQRNDTENCRSQINALEQKVESLTNNPPRRNSHIIEVEIWQQRVTELEEDIAELNKIIEGLKKDNAKLLAELNSAKITLLDKIVGAVDHMRKEEIDKAAAKANAAEQAQAGIYNDAPDTPQQTDEGRKSSVEIITEHVHATVTPRHGAHGTRQVILRGTHVTAAKPQPETSPKRKREAAQTNIEASEDTPEPERRATRSSSKRRTAPEESRAKQSKPSDKKRRLT